MSNLAPTFVAWPCFTLGSRVVHDLIRVKLTDETTALLQAGSHALATIPALFWGRIALTDVGAPGETQCFECGEAVRYDGSAINEELLWDAAQSKCFDRKDGKKKSDNRCAELRKVADAELSASWAVTMHNLATRIDAAPAE